MRAAGLLLLGLQSAAAASIAADRKAMCSKVIQNITLYDRYGVVIAQTTVNETDGTITSPTCSKDSLRVALVDSQGGTDLSLCAGYSATAFPDNAGLQLLTCGTMYEDGDGSLGNGIEIAITDCTCMLPCECNYMLNPVNQQALWDPFVSRNGGVVLQIIGVLFMFLGLAVVCDEFFVPALDVIVERLGISNDVAGATFMAAGGSAPELFTAFIGTFSESTVGFSAIVGSAVFNVLFVIGCCAIFSKETLTLTWWPLARDSTYYCFSLFMLAMFFGKIAMRPAITCDGSDTFTTDPDVAGHSEPITCLNAIYWWEALCLFAMYIGYVVIMKNNVKIFKVVSKCCSGNKPQHRESSNRTLPTDGKVQAIGDEEKAQMTDTAEAAPAGPKHALEHSTSSANVSAKSGFMNFRTGMLTLLTTGDTNNSSAMGVVTRIRGDVRSTFDDIDTSQDGYIDKAEIQMMLETLGLKNVTSVMVGDTLKEIEKVATSWDDTRPEQVSFGEFADWYLKSETRVKVELSNKFKEVDDNNDGFITTDELETLIFSINQKTNVSAEELDSAKKELDVNGDGHITQAEFEGWYESSILFQKHKDTVDDGNADEDGLDMSWPKTCIGRIRYIILLPLVGSLFLTLPDVRKPAKKKYFAITFVGSIMWIGVYSYCMVWWATDIGCVFGISDDIMGLTFLAAGTSVPDLLTSVIVAQQGHGDMAVSSSIGSNIFDVLVGLPLPWLAYSIYNGSTNGKYYTGVDAPTLFIDLLILFGMIATVILTIVVSRWKMTKLLGGSMFVLYVVFVVQSLIRIGQASGKSCPYVSAGGVAV